MSAFSISPRDHGEEGLAKHALTLLEMIHIIVRRLDLQELFHGAIVPEAVVRDGSGEHRQHSIAERRSRLLSIELVRVQRWA